MGYLSGIIILLFKWNNNIVNVNIWINNNNVIIKEGIEGCV